MKQKKFIAISILAVGLIVGSVIFAQAQTDGLASEPSDEQIKASGLTFPVAELGNCNNKQECKAYCDDSTHLDACISFAQSHGLMNKEEATRAEKFKKNLDAGTTPGGCKNPGQCKQFCENIANMETCVKFAEEHGVDDQDVQEGKKIQKFLKQGGQMPGGCQSKQQCEAYCSDFAHMKECFKFAKAAGLSMHDEVDGEVGGEVSEEHFEKIAELMQAGQTPGSCKSKQQCESYCKDESHFEECMTFGEKVGFMKPGEAEKARKFLKQGGPGGCKSRESCEAFCNDDANREVCFTFAQENGMMKEGDLERMKEGMVQLRSGLEQAPPEVQECLKATLGQNVIEKIQSGTLIPGPQIGDSMRGCFDRFGHQGGPQEILKGAPDEVHACVKEKLGGSFGDLTSGKGGPTPEMADTIRVCFEQARLLGGEGGPGGPDGQRGGPGGFPRESGGGPQGGGLENFIRSAPPGIGQCIKEKIGDVQQLDGKGDLGPELKEQIRGCFESFKPESHEGGQGDKFPGGPGGQFPGGPGEQRLPMRQGEGGESGGQFGYPPRAPGDIEQGRVFEQCLSSGGTKESCAQQFQGMQQGGEFQNFQRPSDGSFGPPREGGGQYPSTGSPMLRSGQAGQVPPSPGSFDQQFQQQYQQQYQEQYNQRYQQQSGGYPPPPSTQYPVGSYPPSPTGGTYESSGSYPPPPNGETQPPPPPSSQSTVRSFFGTVLYSLGNFLGIAR